MNNLIDKIQFYFTKGSKRSLKYKKNTVALLVLKGASLFISLLYVPLLLNGMDTENYGIWLTLTSIVMWVNVMDIGLGNGLRNCLTISMAQGDLKKSREYISSAYVALSVYFGALTILLSGVTLLLNWNRILNAPNVDNYELHILVLIVFFTHGVSFILGLIRAILSALQMPAMSGLISFCGQIVSLIVVWVSVRVFNIHSLLILGSIISILPVIIIIIASFILFNGKLSHLKPNIKLYNKELVGSILSLGLKFFFIQILTIVLYQTNNIIIANVINQEAVVEYNIAYKYMGILYSVFMIILTPLWSASTDAYARDDMSWIKNAQKKLMKVGFLFLCIGILMLLVSQPVYRLWLHNDTVGISFWTTFLCLLYVIARTLYGCYGFIINGIGKLHAQMVFTTVIAVIYIPLTLYFGKMFGIYGVIGMSVIVNVFNFGWSFYQYKKLVSKTATGFWNR